MQAKYNSLSATAQARHNSLAQAQQLGSSTTAWLKHNSLVAAAAL
jgi:hypothetical protein